MGLSLELRTAQIQLREWSATPAVPLAPQMLAKRADSLWLDLAC